MEIENAKDGAKGTRKEVRLRGVGLLRMPIDRYIKGRREGGGPVLVRVVEEG